jgi:ferredoxin-NADP reductase
MNDLLLKVYDLWPEGASARAFDLRPIKESTLPRFRAGAHINVELERGLERQYSLLNDPAETHRYVIAVALETKSRGGSHYLCTRVARGDVLKVSTPRNHFELHDKALHSVLLAGGIGITPIWAMAQTLARQARSWTLHYGARNPAAAALLGTVRTIAGDVRCYFQDDGAMMDIAAIVRGAPQGSHFYCCGPATMLAAFKAATATLPHEVVHFEQFTPAGPAALEGGFVVDLAKSKRSFAVRHGQSILEAVLAGGVRVPYSCREGVCGECETRVLEGVPDHRDAILSDAERAQNKVMMICCSGSHSPRLVLDR